MLYSLLSATDTLKTVGKVLLWVLLFGAIFVFLFYLPNKREKARQEEETKKLAAMKVGTKIKTIGGIYGVIVEINDAENFFIIETGSEEHKGYLKIDKRAVYDSDAVVPEEAAPVQATETEEPASEPTEEPFEETATEETPAEEAPVEETPAEEVPVEETPAEETEEKVEE